MCAVVYDVKNIVNICSPVKQKNQNSKSLPCAASLIERILRSLLRGWRAKREPCLGPGLALGFIPLISYFTVF